MNLATTLPLPDSPAATRRGRLRRAVARRSARRELKNRLAAARQRLAEAGCPVPAVEARTRFGWVRGDRRGRVTKPATRPITFTDDSTTFSPTASGAR